MSYILEALKRADAERREEKLPGLHTPSNVALSAGLPDRQRRLLVWASAGFILLIVLGLAWQKFGGNWTKQSSTSSAASPEPQSVQVAAVSAAPPVEKSDEQSNATPATKPPGPTRAAALPPPPPAAVLRAATHEPARPSVTEKQTKSDDASKPGLPAGVAAVARPAPSETIDRRTVEIAAAGPKKPVAEAPRMTELPAAVRRTLPVVTMGGYIYTADPASRSVVINGRLAREGETIEPGLQLEQMRPKDAIFNYQGTRYLLPY